MTAPAPQPVGSPEGLSDETARVLSEFDQLDADMVDAVVALVAALWSFEWLGRNDAEVSIVNDDGVPSLRLGVWAFDSDDVEEEGEWKPLSVTRPVERYVPPRQQIRDLIHWHLCHEVDERLAFANELAFYPVHEPHPTRPGVSLVD